LIPKGLYIFRSSSCLSGSTPSGSHIVSGQLCYKYWNPSDSFFDVQHVSLILRFVSPLIEMN